MWFSSDAWQSQGQKSESHADDEKKVSEMNHTEKRLMTNRKHTEERITTLCAQNFISFQWTEWNRNIFARAPRRVRTRKFTKLKLICRVQIKPVAKSVKLHIQCISKAVPFTLTNTLHTLSINIRLSFWNGIPNSRHKFRLYLPVFHKMCVHYSHANVFFAGSKRV